MAKPRRQVLLEAVQSALQEIDGTGSYTNSLEVGAVQLRQHAVDGEERTGQELSEAQSIMVAVEGGAEEGEVVTVDEILWTMSIGMKFFLGGDADEEDRSAALADMQLAIAAGIQADGLGVGARAARYARVTADPETGQPYDSVTLIATVVYEESFDDPTGV